MQLQPNTVFDNHYTLVRQLGRGGFSEVWLAHDSYMDLDVALKIYAPGQGMDNTSINEFRHEIKDVFNLSHPNLLTPKYLGIYEQMPYLVLSYCQGGSVTQLIGKMSEQQIWKLIHDVASGLAYLHQRDIVHQDIKPDNILIDDAGNYVITDFGISTKARSTLRKSVLGGAVSGGTMAYMGPERFSKDPAPTKASDIWSFGAMVYELIIGNVPFGEMGGGMQKSGAEIPNIKENVSNSLKETIEQMLALNTWDRPTAEQLINAKDVQPAPVAKEVKVEPQSEPTSRATQRFVETPSVETKLQSIKEESSSTEIAKEGKWRWLPILEAILLLPIFVISITQIIIIFAQGFGYLGWLFETSVIISFILCLILYYYFLELLITCDSRKRKWIGVLLPILSLAYIAMICRSDFVFVVVSIIYCILCLVIWFIFQNRIVNIIKTAEKRKIFNIVISIIYAIALGFVVLSSVYRKNQIKETDHDKDLTFYVDNVPIKMIYVKGGTFTMGGIGGGYNDEYPAHEVTLSDYYIAETELTIMQWEKIMKKSYKNWLNEIASFNGFKVRITIETDIPACYISYPNAVKVVEKLNSMLAGELGNKKFYLPTEAEWEYAAKGGKNKHTYEFSGGNDIEKLGWYKGNANGPKSVKSLSPNELGVYDMTGNVSEWCLDWHGDYSSEAQLNPSGPKKGTIKIYRGGGWDQDISMCRNSTRTSGVSNGFLFSNQYNYKDMGMRLVLK